MEGVPSSHPLLTATGNRTRPTATIQQTCAVLNDILRRYQGLSLSDSLDLVREIVPVDEERAADWRGFVERHINVKLIHALFVSDTRIVYNGPPSNIGVRKGNNAQLALGWRPDQEAERRGDRQTYRSEGSDNMRDDRLSESGRHARNDRRNVQSKDDDSWKVNVIYDMNDSEDDYDYGRAYGGWTDGFSTVERMRENERNERLEGAYQQPRIFPPGFRPSGRDVPFSNTGHNEYETMGWDNERQSRLREWNVRAPPFRSRSRGHDEFVNLAYNDAPFAPQEEPPRRPRQPLPIEKPVENTRAEQERRPTSYQATSPPPPQSVPSPQSSAPSSSAHSLRHWPTEERQSAPNVISPEEAVAYCNKTWQNFKKLPLIVLILKEAFQQKKEMDCEQLRKHLENLDLEFLGFFWHADLYDFGFVEFVNDKENPKALEKCMVRLNKYVAACPVEVISPGVPASLYELLKDRQSLDRKIVRECLNRKEWEPRWVEKWLTLTINQKNAIIMETIHMHPELFSIDRDQKILLKETPSYLICMDM